MAISSQIYPCIIREMEGDGLDGINLMVHHCNIVIPPNPK
nr:MAG TPA: hypothetical protein [Bacteriophage sp.]